MNSILNKINQSRNALCIAVTAVLMCISQIASAQLSTAFNIGSVLSNSGNAELLFKYELKESAMAARFKLSGNHYINKNIQNFYEDDNYLNLDKWPEDVSKEGGKNTGGEFGVVPGLELRNRINDKTLFYYGLEVGLTFGSGQYMSNSHYSYKSADKYIIQQVRSYNYSSNYTTIYPTALIGLQRSLGGGFNALLEASVFANFQKSTTTNENLFYTWNPSLETFEKPAAADEFKPQPIPWYFYSNFTPQIDLYISYTFGS